MGSSRTVQDLQISDFIDTIKRELNDEQISDLRKNWEVIFKHLAISQDRIVIAIDEIPYLIESDKALTSTFQRIIDLYIAESNLFLYPLQI